MRRGRRWDRHGVRDPRQPERLLPETVCAWLWRVVAQPNRSRDDADLMRVKECRKDSAAIAHQCRRSEEGQRDS